MKKLLPFLFLITVFLTPQVSFAKEAYAVLSDSTLTFYFDNKMEEREGEKYQLNYNNSKPGWQNDDLNIGKVIFDPSFAKARPTSTYYWFPSTVKEIEGIEHLNTSEVTNMANMFYNCQSLTSLDVSGFDTSNVTNMGGMFYNCQNLTSLDVSGFDTSNVTYMRYMFFYCQNLTSLDVSGFDTSNVTDMGGMFSYCQNLTSLDVSGFDTSNVTNMVGMFSYCQNLASLDVSGFDTSKVTNMYTMFFYCQNLTSLDVSGFDTSNVTDMKNMFSYCQNLTNLDVSGFDTSNVTNIRFMFSSCSKLTSLNVSGFDTSNVTDMWGMFSNCSKLTSLNVSGFDTSNVTDMRNMFFNCQNLTSLDVSGFDTSNVTNLEHMFYNCQNLTSLNVSGFDTSNVTSLWSMFAYCNNLTSLDVSGFDTSNVTNLREMFYNCQNLSSLNVSGFDTSNVTDMWGMFYNCQNLTSLDVSGFDTSNVTNLGDMFNNCQNLTSLDVSGFDTSNVTSLRSMFAYCNNLTSLDVSAFDTSNVTDMRHMFYNCQNLTTIFCGKGWNTGNVTYSDGMFYNCVKLVGGLGTVYDSNHMDGSYAHVDGGESNPGYFTYNDTDNVVITIYDEDGNMITDGVTITWFDENRNPIGNGFSLGGMEKGAIAFYTVTLNERLGRVYREVDLRRIEVDGSNVVCHLKRIETLNVEGEVYADGMPQGKAEIQLTQWLNGKYEYTTNAQTDEHGHFSISAYNDSTKIVVSVDGYIYYTMTRRHLGTGQLGTVYLQDIEGCVLLVDMKYQQTVDYGETPIIHDYLNNTGEILFSVHNTTTNTDIDNIYIKNGALVLPNGTSNGDRLSVTAHSLSGSFADAHANCTISTNDTTTVELLLIEPGGIKVCYDTKEDDNLLALLYDADGNLAAHANFSTKSLMMERLTAGNYQLVTMGSNGFANPIGNMDDLLALGLIEGNDYVKNQVNIQDGYYTKIAVDNVPESDASKFEYTSINTSYMANRNLSTLGRFVTLTARVDFKEQFLGEVDNVKLLITLPDGCSFIDNSLVVANEFSQYVLDGNLLTIPLTREQIDCRVRFCVTSLLPGTFTSTANVSFNYRGEKMQPVGSSVFEVTGQSLHVPSKTAQSTIIMRGVTAPKADVDIYDNDHLIGSTQALADGNWKLSANLYEPYNHSIHSIYAKINQNGVCRKTTAAQCIYDINYVMPHSVTMSFHNGWMKKNISLTFDFETGETSDKSYSFYTKTDFTFVADLSRNDTVAVKGVTFNVFTSNHQVEQLQGFYDESLGRWVAVGNFGSNNLPINLSLDIETNERALADQQEIDDVLSAFANCAEEYYAAASIIDDIINDETDVDDIDQLLLENDIAIDTNDDNLTLEQMDNLTDEEIDSILAECRSLNLDEEISLIDSMADEISQSFAFEKYGEYHFDNGNSYLATTCEGIDEVELEGLGFEKCQTTNNSYVYLLTSENKTEWIDFENDLHLILTTKNKETAKSKVKGDGLDVFNEWMDNINICYDRIKKAYDEFSEAFNFQLEDKFFKKWRNELIDANQKVRSATKYQRAYNIKLMRLEKEAKSLNSLTVEYQIKMGEISECKAEMKSVRKWVNAAKRSQAKAQVALKAARPLRQLMSKVSPISKYGSIVLDGLSLVNDYKQLFDSIPDPCNGDQEHAEMCKRMCKSRMIVSASTLVAKLMADAAVDAAIGVQAIGSVTTGGASALTAAITILGKMVVGFAFDYAYKLADESLRKGAEEEIKKLKCHVPDENPSSTGNNLDNISQPPFKDVTPILDPSGYVYEAVPSNRLDNVTATIFYDNNGPQIWDATDYSQENPIVTDETGLYAWDVPQGKWLVRFEKAGYEPAQTEWLPVPPPQMEVNIPMEHAIAPVVTKAYGTESGVWLNFSKYMKPSTLKKNGRVIVTKEGKDCAGEVLMLDAEENPYNGNTYASKIKFIPTKAFQVGDEVVVTVKKDVESYANMMMDEDFVARLTIQPDLHILCDSVMAIDYQSSAVLEIAVLPAANVKGKRVTIESMSPMIAVPNQSEITLDNEGKGSVTVSGILPGSTSLCLSVSDACLQSFCNINVVLPESIVRAPKASKRSGSVVEAGYKLTLSSATKGATIYYTTDGSCPCDNEKRILYSGPIIVNDNMTIKAIAVRHGMEDSDVSTFSYYVLPSSVNDAKQNSSIEIKQSGYSVIINSTEKGTIMVYDNAGRALMTQRKSNGDTTTINIPRKGIYLLNIELGNSQTIVRKIIIK